MDEEVMTLPAERALVTSEPFVVFHANAAEIPNTLREIGRQREIAFRKAGEGTGRPADLDEFDEYYIHLFLWNRETKEVVGAYRLGRADEIPSRFGDRGLYTSTFSYYDTVFLNHINPALELGRSFVRPEYQKSFPPLFLLWKGIARYVAQHPQYKTLFGAVSISDDYQPVARRFIVDCLSSHNYRHELAELVRPRTPFRNKIKDRAFRKGSEQLVDIEEVSAFISDIEADRKGIPVLLKQYLKLGGKLLGFNVDHSFSDALDGLILVDLTSTDVRLMSKLMGEDRAERFLNFTIAGTCLLARRPALRITFVANSGKDS